MTEANASSRLAKFCSSVLIHSNMMYAERTMPPIGSSNLQFRSEPMYCGSQRTAHIGVSGTEAYRERERHGVEDHVVLGVLSEGLYAR